MPTRPAKRRKKERPHKPGLLGPRVYLRGRYFQIDLRSWGGGRGPIRNPKAHGWPAQGEQTEDAQVAYRWASAYLDAVQDDTTRRQLGKRAASKPLGVEAVRYLAHVEQTQAPKTLLNHSTALTVQFVPFVGEGVNVEAIDTALVQAWVTHLLAQGYAIGTCRQYLTTVRAFCRWRSKGAHDPTKDVQLPDPGERDVEPLTETELAKLRAAADAMDREAPAVAVGRIRRSYRLLVELAFGTGARLGELAAIRWAAFDPNSKTVRIQWQAPLAGTASKLRPLKGKKARTALCLPEWWEHYAAFVGETDPATLGCVLSSDPASPYVSLGSVDFWMTRILERSGLVKSGRGAHALRHSYAQAFIVRGGRLEQLQRSLGHASIRTTETAYSWMSQDTAAALARSAIYTSDGLRLVSSPKRATR